MKSFPLFLMLVYTGAQAAPVPLAINSGGSFEGSYQLSTGPSTAATLQITGNLTGDIEMTDGVISKFRFLGGNVAYSDTTSNIVISTFPVVARVRLLTRGIVSSATGNSSAGAINPITGVISNNGHQLIQDRGTVTTRYMVGNTVIQEEIRDLAQKPDANPLVGTTTVTSSLLENRNYKARYRIDFTHTRDEARTQPAEVVNGTLRITEEGSFSASGEIWMPGQTFTSWALNQRGQTPLSLNDLCATSGQPLILLYAFDATAGAWTPPVTFDQPSGLLRIDLPASGLKAPVRLEFSSTLTGGAWQPLTRAGNMPSIFNIAEFGSVTVDLPPGQAGFVRLCLAE
jgi:hypothetical protein